jgi:isoquinoline 1-oxidoreductase beta subunit
MTMQISRRDFLGGSAGLTFAFAIGAGEANAQATYSPTVWVTIASDGTITIVSPAAEMGQGTLTTLPAIIADELDADWSKVRTLAPPAWEEKKWGNPSYNGAFQTSASASVQGYFKPLRIAGAQARRVLLDAVAARWNVAVDELATEPSTRRQAGA